MNAGEREGLKQIVARLMATLTVSYSQSRGNKSILVLSLTLCKNTTLYSISASTKIYD